MCILEGGSLCKMNKLYDYSKHRIRIDRLQGYLHIFESNYSREFVMLIKDMLKVNPNERPDAKTIF